MKHRLLKILECPACGRSSWDLEPFKTDRSGPSEEIEDALLHCSACRAAFRIARDGRFHRIFRRVTARVLAAGFDSGRHFLAAATAMLASRSERVAHKSFGFTGLSFRRENLRLMSAAGPLVQGVTIIAQQTCAAQLYSRRFRPMDARGLRSAEFWIGRGTASLAPRRGLGPSRGRVGAHPLQDAATEAAPQQAVPARIEVRGSVADYAKAAARILAPGCVFAFVFPTLELDRVISHPWMAHVHEIHADTDGIWVTSTGGNGVFKVGVDQRALEAHWLTSEPSDDLRVHLDRTRDLFHVNTVFEREGVLFAYSMVTGQVFSLHTAAGGGRKLVPFAQLEPGCHNVVLTEHGWFRNESATSTVRIGERSMHMPRHGVAGEFTEPGWLRGMARTPSGRFLVGSSPASLYEIDPVKMEIVDAMSLSDDVCWTILGIYVDDAAIVEPPTDVDWQQTQARLAQLVGRA